MKKILEELTNWAYKNNFSTVYNYDRSTPMIRKYSKESTKKLNNILLFHVFTVIRSKYTLDDKKFNKIVKYLYTHADNAIFKKIFVTDNTFPGEWEDWQKISTIVLKTDNTYIEKICENINKHN